MLNKETVMSEENNTIMLTDPRTGQQYIVTPSDETITAPDEFDPADDTSEEAIAAAVLAQAAAAAAQQD